MNQIELNEIWNKLKALEEDSFPEQVVIKRKSNNPFFKLKKNLLIIWWLNLIAILFGVVLFLNLFELGILSKICLSILILESVYHEYKIYSILINLNRIFNRNKISVIDFATQQLGLTKKTIKLIENRTLIFMPLGYITGIILNVDFSSISVEAIKSFLVAISNDVLSCDPDNSDIVFCAF